MIAKDGAIQPEGQVDTKLVFDSWREKEKSQVAQKQPNWIHSSLKLVALKYWLLALANSLPLAQKPETVRTGAACSALLPLKKKMESYEL